MSRFEAIGRRTFLMGLAGVGASFLLPIGQAKAELFQPFSFAFVSDCHLITGVPDSFKLTQESQLFLQDAIKQINRLAPDFVIFGGDQVDLVGSDEANWQLFIDIVQTLNCPWTFVLGERDVSGTVPVDKMKTYGPDWKGKGLTGDKPYWSQDILPAVHLIGLDTSCPNVSTGDLSAEQLAWLQKDLDNQKRGFIIVASHHPLLPPAPYDGGPPWDQYVVPQAASAREILNSSSRVHLALSGHVYATKIEREKDIWYVSCPALDVYPCAFRFFRVDPESITIETYQIAYPALVKKARGALLASTLAFHYNNSHPGEFLDVAAGTREDQNARLPLRSGQPLEGIKRREPPKPEVVQEKVGKKKKHKEAKKPAKAKKAKEELPKNKTGEKVSVDDDSATNAREQESHASGHSENVEVTPKDNNVPQSGTGDGAQGVAPEPSFPKNDSAQ